MFMGLLCLLAALIVLVPTFQGTKYAEVSSRLSQESFELDVWQSKADFRAWCHDEKVW
jgi:hypothetical protein